MGGFIYIVEDEESIRELIHCTLTSNGYNTSLFSNSTDMLSQVVMNLPDMILLDVMLPDIDGFDTLKILKNNIKTKGIPIILITAKSSEIDKVKGLDLGADDYITKPFGILELLARIRACMRRKEGCNNSSKLLKTDSISINLDTMEVFKDGELIELTLKEFNLLKLLIQNSKKVLERKDILETIWGYDFIGETRTLDMHIKTLRTKLGDNIETPKYIKTIRGIGYKFIESML